jgi:hypothetical protein
MELHSPELPVVSPPEKAPEPVAAHWTGLSVGLVGEAEVSVTVAVQVVAEFTVTGLGVQLTVVVVGRADTAVEGPGLKNWKPALPAPRSI